MGDREANQRKLSGLDAAGAVLPDSIIDFHVHLFPDKGFDAIWKVFEIAYGASMPYKLYHRQCIAYLNSRSVDPIVFSNYAHKRGFAGPMSAWNLRLLDEYPGLFCFQPYHPDDPDALRIAEQALQHPRVAGIKMHFQVQRIYPHDPRLFPLYEMVIDKGKRLLLHTGNGPTGNEFVGYEQFKILLDRYPDLPVNVPHMGSLEFEKFMRLLDRHPHLYLDTAYCFWPQVAFRFSLGAHWLERYQDRIVYGSDFPNIMLPRRQEIETLVSFGLPRSFYRKIFFENGLKLLAAACPEAGLFGSGSTVSNRA